MRVYLGYCARCGPDTPHPTPYVWAYRFTRNPIEADGKIYTHWFLCPITKEPTLVSEQTAT